MKRGYPCCLKAAITLLGLTLLSPSGALQAATCFSPEQALESLGPYTSAVESEHFIIRFNPDPERQLHEARAGQLLDWFEESLTVMTSELGFLAPQGIESFQMLIAVELLPSPNVGGFTSLAPCQDSEMAFVVVNSQWFSDDQRLKSLAPHELFHAIQVRYAFDGLWGAGAEQNRWWIEASAAFMEWLVFPELNETQQAHSLQWSQEPWRALRSNAASGFQYGSWLLAASITESLDQADWHRQLWERLAAAEQFDVVTEVDATLLTQGSSFADEWGNFIERAATMDFSFGDGLDTPGTVFDSGQGGLAAAHSAAELPIDAIILANSSPPAPQTLGTAYVRLEAPTEPSALHIELEAIPESNGQSRDFAFHLVAIADGAAGQNHRLLTVPLTGTGGSEGGTVVLDGFGGTWDQLLIAASPTASGQNHEGASWGYRLRLEPSSGGSDFSVPGQSDSSTGCSGCSTTGPTSPTEPVHWLLSLLLLAPSWSRRRPQPQLKSSFGSRPIRST